jgi:glyoxylase I family protein
MQYHCGAFVPGCNRKRKGYGAIDLLRRNGVNFPSFVSLPMLRLKKVHHIAVICSDYERSKDFYCRILGFKIVAETYRKERDSYKLDLSLNGRYIIELFSFPNYIPRPSGPEATGLRHLAFEVENIEEAVQSLNTNGVSTEPIRVDAGTRKKFTFFRDPDDLPLELYQS